MATELQFSVGDDNAGFYVNVYDETGAYSTVNTGGHGSPNTALSSIQWATIKIKRRNTTTEYTIDVFPDLPNVNKAFYHRIDATDFGFATEEKIASDLYLFTYEIGHYNSGNPITDASESFYVPLIPKLRCCVKSMHEKLNVPLTNPCECKDKTIASVGNIKELLEAICDAVGCDQLDRAKALIDYVSQWCQCNCTTCN